MKKLLVALQLTCCALPTFGADIKAPPAKAPAAIAAPVDMYSGFYLGAELGYGFNLGDTVGGDQLVTLGPLSTAPQGFLGGAYGGLGTRFGGSFYVGVEANGDWANLTGTAGTPGALAGFNTMGASVKNDWLASARARVGFITNENVLIYGTGGWGWGASALAIDANGATAFSNSATQSGFTWGGGIEFPLFAPAWKARVQYLQYDFGTYTACAAACTTTIPVTVSNKDRIDTVTVGLSYKF